MSDTIVDMSKVTQMLDNGWHTGCFKNELGSYTAVGRHLNLQMIAAVNQKLLALCSPEIRDIVEEGMERDSIDTDDFTPEQVLTRLAYKVGGTILES